MTIMKKWLLGCMHVVSVWIKDSYNTMHWAPHCLLPWMHVVFVTVDGLQTIIKQQILFIFSKFMTFFKI